MRTPFGLRRSPPATPALALALLCLALPAAAQELSPEQFQELRTEIDRHIAAYARYRPGATGFEGLWELSGERTHHRRGGDASAGYAGELLIDSFEDGEVLIEGKVRLDGRSVGKWEGSGKVGADGVLRTTYSSTVGGEGTAEYAFDERGRLKVTWRSHQGGRSAPTYTGEGLARRTIDLSREALERRLHELHARERAHRYPRPQAERFRSRRGTVQVDFLPDVVYAPGGVEERVVRLIDGARESVDVCVFELSLLPVAQALVRAHARKVAVRVVHDDRVEGDPALELLRKNGVPLRSDARSAYMHNKFLVVDREQVWCGSTNLSRSGVYESDNNAVLVRSRPLAARFRREFEEMYVDGQFGVTSPANTDHAWIELEPGISAQVYFAPEDQVLARLIELVRGARKKVEFLAFAFTSDPLADAMIERVQDGVAVSGVFEARHARWNATVIRRLHRAGADVRVDVNPGSLHHKVIVIDDELVCTGSFNFSESAERTNDEHMLVLRGPEVARAFGREVAAILAMTDPDDPRISASADPALAGQEDE